VKEYKFTTNCVVVHSWTGNTTCSHKFEEISGYYFLWAEHSCGNFLQLAATADGETLCKLRKDK
jgi:hypothetical protein